ncbi:MAG: TlyA family RNA methyltransferase [Erysipelotrichia bacterium]|nr:TlyA family RNA methyltransferase [Erysipelotrichia bacterium]
MRLDIYLTQQGYFNSRSQASLAIKGKKVKVNNRIITKSGYEINDDDVINVDKEDYEFVSRGGYKLLAAIKNFALNLQDKTVLDIGASTGGFSDCALQFGAKKVYAYDVGENQIADKLRNDSRVVVKEKVNCRYLTSNDFVETIDFICMDVSFISCTKIFPSISSVLSDGNEAVVLFKPQFEVGNKFLNGQGIVKDDKIILAKLNETIKIAQGYELYLKKYCLSPIRGGDGNKEYLLYFVKSFVLNCISEVDELCW